MAARSARLRECDRFGSGAENDEVWLYAIHELRWNARLAIALIAACFAAPALARSALKAARLHRHKRSHAVSGN